MSDIATISLRVDTADLERGEKALDDFQRTAQEAAKTNDDLNSSFRAGASTQRQNSDSLRQQRQDLQALLNQLSPVNKALDNLDAAQEKLTNFRGSGTLGAEQFERYNEILETTRTKLLAVQDAETAEGRARLEQERTAARAAATAKSFVASLESQVNAIGKTRLELLELKAAELGVAEQTAPLIARLREQDEAWKKNGISAGQYKQALRQLPAQLTDIATSLAGGMPFWMVLMQQGGQISDSFGGLGALLKLLKEQLLGIKDPAEESSESLSENANALAENAEHGKSFLSFLTPARVAIGGLVGVASLLAIAWYKGSQEAEAFNKQLILTGNYAGRAVGQLHDLAKEVSDVAGVTIGDAAQTLTKVVGSGRFNSSQLKDVATTAAALNDAIGQSVDTTLRNFQLLYEEPTKASAELNQTLHYLTASQYEHISALERTGDVEAAGEAAAKAYSQAEQQRSQQVIDNLGTIDHLVRAVSDTWGAYWDAALGIGRSQTASDQLEVVQSRIKSLTDPSRPGVFGMGNIGDGGLAKRELVALREQEQALKFVIQSQNGYAEAQEKGNKANNEAIQAQGVINKYLDAGATAADKRKKAQQELNKAIEANAAAAKFGKATLWTQADIEKARAGIEQLYKDPAKAKHRDPNATADREDLDLQRQTLALKVQLDALDKQKDLGSVISKQRRDLLTTESEIAVLTDKAQKEGLNQQEKIKLASDKRTLSERETLAALGDQYEQKKRLLELDKQASKFQEQQRAKEAALKAQAEGKSNRDAQRDAERLRVREQFADSPQAQAKSLLALEERYKKEDELTKNWLAGAKSAWNEYLQTATDVNKQVHDVAAAGLSGLTGMLDDLVTTGKASFSDFAASMIKMIVHIIDQLLIAYAVQTALGWIAGGASQSFSSTGLNDGTRGIPMPPSTIQAWNGGYIPEFDRGGFTGAGGKYEPKGIVHGGEFVFTKEATSALGVDNLYALMRGAQGYANGGYVGGASMAGLKGSNAQPGLAPQIYTTVNVDAGGGTSSNSSSDSDRMGRALANEINNATLQVIQRQLKNGGIIYNFVKGR